MNQPLNEQTSMTTNHESREPGIITSVIPKIRKRSMPRPTVFISYRHGDPSTLMAREVYTALAAISDGLHFDLFMDQNDIEPAALFDKVILDGLDRTTHFLVLLDNQYWASSYCRKELAHAIQ